MGDDQKPRIVPGRRLSAAVAIGLAVIAGGTLHFVFRHHGMQTEIPTHSASAAVPTHHLSAPEADSPIPPHVPQRYRPNPAEQPLPASLGAALSAARHAVEALDPSETHSRGADYFAANPKQQLRAWFSGDGIELASGLPTPEGREPWRLKLRLLESGRPGAMTRLAPGAIVAGANRVELKPSHGAITQWFENRGDGLEQGFTLMQPPAGGTGEVTLLLGVEGSLRPSPLNASDSLRFVDTTGADVIHYTGLKAWDADGRTLHARVEARGTGTVALVVADAGARYPITVDPLFANVEARLVEQPVAQNYFGSAVAISGDTAVIGAPLDDTLGRADSGSAYLFGRTGGTWRLHAKLYADDLAEQDNFGGAVAISGDTVLVGAEWAASGGVAGAGKAYLFVRNGAAWSQQAILAASNPTMDAHFGASVGLSGDTAIIGSPADDPSGLMDAGSATLFVRSGVTWSQQAELTAMDAAEGDAFGSSVSVDGERALVGAPSDNTPAGTDAGSAYLFARSGSAWNHEAHLTAPAGASDDSFGCSVAISGDTVLVGANAADTADEADAGLACVFLRSGVVWNLQATLEPASAQAGDAFGSAVALDGETALIGAPEHASGGQAGSGSATIFLRSGGAWIEDANLAGSAPASGDSFGGAVAISGTTALVGVPADDTEAGPDAGSAAVFHDAGAGWNPQAQLVADNSPSEDFFGVSVSVSGDVALVGSYADDTANGVDAGSAYVFLREGMLWVQESKLTPNDGMTGDAFGSSVAVSGGTALVGASGADTPGGANAGNVSVFVREGVGWVETQVIVVSGGAANDRFGCSLSLGDDTALIGASGDDTIAGADAGSAFVFRLAGGIWNLEAQLGASDAAAGDGFGGAVALDGDTALVGVGNANTPAGLDAGRAVVFMRNDTTWAQQAVLIAPDGAADDRFGSSVALSGNTALVGSPNDNVPGTLQAGSAYVFARDGTTWSNQAKLAASDATQGKKFGFSVSIDGETALIGAPFDNLASGLSAGSAYVFSRDGTIWSEQLKLTSGVDASAWDEFGISVALSGDTALVGAYADSTAGPMAGSAYVYLLGTLPSITGQPASRIVLPGETAAFAVTATGYQPLRYQWRKDGFPIDGATGPTYTILSAQISDQGTYDCVVSNIGGVATSAPATLAVNALSLLSRSGPDAPPEAQGYVFVTLIPSGINSGWRFAGEQGWRSSGVPVGGLTTGDRVIEFRPVPGYIQPLDEPVSVISGGAATVIQAEYYESSEGDTGGLGVVLKPDSLADGALPEADRAQWRLLGEDDTQWRDSGATLSALPPGNYLVECKPLTGRTTPPTLSVPVVSDATRVVTATYFLASEPTGAQPAVLSFETVNSSDPTLPYAYVGQIRSASGVASGFVVKPRVVATAAHVVFDDGSLSYVTDLQWLFQHDRGRYEPVPQVPHGSYLFEGYAAQRTADNSPGVSTPQSQHLDVAALYFLEDAGRGGYGGYLASDLEDNEFLLSDSLKTLVGYPVDGVPASRQGRMHATPPANIEFARAFGRTFATEAITSAGGNSGGPLCVQADNGNYYAAAIYLGGSAQTVVRAIDSEVIDIFSRAEVSANGGDNNVGGGITQVTPGVSGAIIKPAFLKVTIQPAGAVSAGAKWKLGSTPYASGSQMTAPSGKHTVSFVPVPGYLTPPNLSVTLTGGNLTSASRTYSGITAHPQSATVSASANATFSVAVSGTPTAYQWRRNGVDIAGATSATYTRTNVTLADSGTYSVAVTWGSSGSLTSNAATLDVAPLPQTIDFAPLADRLLGSGTVALSASASSALPVGFSVLSGPANLAGNSLTLTGYGTVTLRASQSGNAIYAAAPDVDRNFQVVGETHDTWGERFFSTDELADAAVSGPVSDPDADGIPNLIEFALNMDPKTPDRTLMVATTGTGGLPLIKAESAGGQPHLTVEFVRRTAASTPGVSYAVEFCSDLPNPLGWSVPGASAETVTPIDATWERVKVTDPETSSRRFGRITITRQ